MTIQANQSPGVSIFGATSAGGGGSTSPGGSSGQAQYNNGGSFGGMSGTSWDDTNRSLTLTGATVTTSQPVLNLSQTWNAGAVTFTGLRFNATDTASASGSLLLDLQVGGTSRVSITKSGGVKCAPNGPAYILLDSEDFQHFNSAGVRDMLVGGNALGVALPSNYQVTWGNSSTAPLTPDLFLRRAAAATLQLGAADVASGAVAQTLQVQSNTGAGTTGPNFTIKGSAGTTAGGSIIFQTAATTSYATALTINSAKQIVFDDGTTIAPSIQFSQANTGFSYLSSGINIAISATPYYRMANTAFRLQNTLSFGWSSGDPTSIATDVALWRDAANTLALRNSTNAQTFNWYGSYTDATVYKRGALSFKTYSAADYITVTAEANTGNIGVVLQPKGTGAIVAQMPDGTTAGGNARGTNAVDLQMSRSAATRVASGSNSFAAGLNCTASGSNGSVAMGDGSTASGERSLSIGSATASGQYSIAIGDAAVSSALTSVAMQNATGVSANFAFGFGRSTTLDKISQFGCGTEQFASGALAQYSTLILSESTADATPKALTIRLYNTGTGQTKATVPANTTWAFTAHVSGRSSSGTNNAYYIRQGVIKRDGANNTTLVGTVQTIGTDIESDAAWDVAVTADDTNECLLITVTGVAATNIRWLAKVDLVEIGYS